MLQLSIAAVVGLLCIILAVRFVFRKLVKNAEIGMYVDEFLLNVQSSACVMELGVIGTLYGFESHVWLAGLFTFLFFKFNFVVYGNLIANPLTYLDRYYSRGRKRDSVFTILSVIIVQVLGCLLGQLVMKEIWNFMSNDHINARDAVCLATVADSWIHAAIAEGTAVFAGFCISFFLPIQLFALVNAAVSVYIIAQFGRFSGMWMNPMVASSHTFRCQGHVGDWQHFMVYWVGPIFGATLAYEIREIVNSMRHKQKQA